MLFEELLDDPHERVVVLRTVDLRDKRSPLLEVLRGHSEGVQSDLVLLVGVFLVGGSHVRGTVAQNNVRLQCRVSVFGNSRDHYANGRRVSYRRLVKVGKLENWHLGVYSANSYYRLQITAATFWYKSNK